ncbi:MAG: RDD family protein [Candidatus Sulfotelmatobacter sp.]
MSSVTDECAPADSTAWRQEVAARLNRYQSRRKPRPPRYPSLLLRFDGDDAIRVSAPPPSFKQPSCDHALALDEYPLSRPDAGLEQRNLAETEAVPEPSALLREFEPADDFSDDAAVTRSAIGRIIQFPCSWTPPPVPVDQLAEPVMSRPRILEAPEFVPPPPALGGITIEPPQQPEMEKRPGIDIPLQGAPLGRRVLSALIDDVIIVAACAVFGFIFWKLTAIRPPRLQMITLVAGLAALLWAAYQYLLMVYAGITPGLHLARLELTRFDGSSAGRRLRRWRVLASYLSAISLGMGYLWVFLDEDSLCWHDRITHTYLAPKKSPTTSCK